MFTQRNDNMQDAIVEARLKPLTSSWPSVLPVSQIFPLLLFFCCYELPVTTQGPERLLHFILECTLGKLWCSLFPLLLRSKIQFSLSCARKTNLKFRLVSFANSRRYFISPNQNTTRLCTVFLKNVVWCIHVSLFDKRRGLGFF